MTEHAKYQMSERENHVWNDTKGFLEELELELCLKKED